MGEFHRILWYPNLGKQAPCMCILHKFRKMQFLAFSHTEVGKRLQNRLVFSLTVMSLRVGAAEKRDLYVILPFLLLYSGLCHFSV